MPRPGVGRALLQPHSGARKPHNLGVAHYLLDQKHISLSEEQPDAVCLGDIPGSPASLQEYLYMANPSLPGPGQRTLGERPYPCCPACGGGTWDQRARPQCLCVDQRCSLLGPSCRRRRAEVLPHAVPCLPARPSLLGKALPGLFPPASLRVHPCRMLICLHLGMRRELDILWPPPDPGLPGVLQGSEPDTRSHGDLWEGCSSALEPFW